MAWMNKERKKELAPGIKEVLKKYGVKGTIAVRNSSTLVVNIKSGPIDLTGGKPYGSINPYCPGDEPFAKELIEAMKVGWYDKSDNKPYTYTG